jgi:endonuclease/exonuclease/phosphatase (EEP) superfamily protein YafD
MSDSSRISIIQHNTARSQNIMYSVLETAKESATDFVLIQEPWIAINENMIYTISHPTYDCILPNIVNNIRPRVAIYAKKQSVYKFCQRTDLTADSDIIIIDVSDQNIESFQIINIYNEKSLDSDSDSSSNSYTVERSLQNIQLSKETLVAGDFNAHHS